MMDDHHFDELTKELVGRMGSRRATLRLMTGSGLGVLAAWFGGVDVAEAKNKDKHKNKKKDKDRKRKKRHLAECSGDGDCAACERCIGGECSMGLVAPCDASQCQEPVCIVATKTSECRRTCLHPDAVCCKGTCYAPCSNGCEINDSCDACNKPPAGKVYCASSDRCLDQCPPGQHFNPERCRCEQCEEVCDPQTGMCHSRGCQVGHRCINGFCNSGQCTDPGIPQLCCVQKLDGSVRCSCTSADAICFNCNGEGCSCVPGGPYCCDPRYHGPHCPAECLCP